MVLMGLNRIYVPSDNFKSLAWLIEKIRIAPPELSPRLKRVFRIEPPVAVRELSEVVEECLLLVEQQMPEIDTAHSKSSPEDTHKPWDQPPP